MEAHQTSKEMLMGCHMHFMDKISGTALKEVG